MFFISCTFISRWILSLTKTGWMTVWVKAAVFPILRGRFKGHFVTWIILFLSAFLEKSNVEVFEEEPKGHFVTKNKRASNYTNRKPRSSIYLGKLFKKKQCCCLANQGVQSKKVQAWDQVPQWKVVIAHQVGNKVGLPSATKFLNTQCFACFWYFTFSPKY